MTGDAAFDDADLCGLADGRIEPARAAALEASLASDRAATARMDAWRRQNESLRTMFASVLTEPIPVRLLPVSVGARGRGAAPERRDEGGRRAVGAVASVVVGAMLVGFALGALTSFGTDGFGFGTIPARTAGDAGAHDFASRAAEAHRTFLADPARPVETAAADGAKPERWLRRRLGAGLRVPDLAAQGWTFLGGRVVPGRIGPAVFLSYGSGLDRLGLLVSAGEGGDGRVVAADGSASLGVATFRVGSFGFALTADRGPEWLSRNLGPLRASVEAQGRGAGEATPR